MFEQRDTIIKTNGKVRLAEIHREQLKAGKDVDTPEWGAIKVWPCKYCEKWECKCGRPI